MFGQGTIPVSAESLVLTTKEDGWDARGYDDTLEDTVEGKKFMHRFRGFMAQAALRSQIVSLRPRWPWRRFST